MAQANLSEILFKPKFKHPETSTLVRHAQCNHAMAVHSALDGDTTTHWYRMINRLMWIWRGIDRAVADGLIDQQAVVHAQLHHLAAAV